MSLIPSESHSFPDNYSPVAWSRKAKRKNLSQARPAIEVQQRNVVPLPAQTRETKAPPSSSVQSPDEQFFQSLGKLTEQSATPPPSTAEKMEEPTPSLDQNPVAQFFESLGKLAEQNSAPLPEQNGEIAPPPFSPEQGPVTQFFQSLEKLAETNAAPLPAPVGEMTPPAPSPVHNIGEQFFQPLETPDDRNAPPMPTEPAPRRLPIAPIRRGPRPPVAPVSPENVDEATLLTANGRGRARQYRPKTPLRVAKPVSMVPAERAAAPVVNPPASKSFAQQPHDEFDFADLSTDVERERSARRHRKFKRFMLIEIIALVVLIPSAWLVLSRHITSPVLVLLMNILTITAAATMAVVPIVLYGITPGGGRPDR